MNKINLVVVDRNIDYLEFLSAFIRKTDYINTFTTKSFSSSDNLLIHLKEKEKVDILLIDQNMYTPELTVEEIDLIIILSEATTHSTADFSHVYKYQPLNNLFSQVLAVYFEHAGHIPNHGYYQNSTKIISLFATTGGNGKTVLALNLAKQLAQMDYKVFYLSLEAINSAYQFFSITDSYDFSKIIYYLKTTPADINTKIELYKKHDHFLKIDYFEPPASLMEVLELTSEDTVNLINAISETERYDFLIIDLDSSIDGRLVGSFSKSSHFIWLLLDNYLYLSKTKLLLKELTNASAFKISHDRISFIQNKALNKNEDNYLYEFKLAGYLPYISKWKAGNDINQFYNSEDYTEGVIGLIETLILE